MNYLFYNLIVIVTLSLAYLSEKSSGLISRLFLALMFCSLFIFTAIRFDVGPDYYTYVQAYKTLYYADFSIPVSLDYQFFKIISRVFSSYEKGYIGVFAAYFFLTFMFIVLSLRKYNILFLGLVVFFGFGFYFDSIDRMRQFLSLSIFLYSISDIIDNKAGKYYLKIIFASLFHMSALLLLPIYFIAKIKLNRAMIFFAFSFFLLFGILDFYGALIDAIYSLVPVYGDRYYGTTYASGITEFNSKMGFYTKVLFVFVVVYFSVIEEKLRTILFIGLLLMVLASGNLNIGRMASYFLGSLIIAVPLMVVNTKNIINKAFVIAPLMIYLFVLFQFDVNRNNFDYITVYSENFKIESFNKK